MAVCIVFANILIVTAINHNAKYYEPKVTTKYHITPQEPLNDHIPTLTTKAEVCTPESEPSELDELQQAIEPHKTLLGYFTIVAYCLCVICCGIWSAEHPSRIGTDFVQRTASGTIPTAGRTIAVDTSMIPFGTEVYISGLGWRIAEDRGGAIRGNKIDLLMPCHQRALNWGRQTREIYIKN